MMLMFSVRSFLIIFIYSTATAGNIGVLDITGKLSCFLTHKSLASRPVQELLQTDDTDLIFVADYSGRKIYASNLSASGPTSLSAVNVITSEPCYVDYDPEQGYIYWTDLHRIGLLRARYDGTDQVTLIADIPFTYGLAIDLASRRVFWTNVVNGLIEVVYLNGTGRSTFVSDNLANPYAIATDSLHGLLFWTDIDSGPSSKIERANMDGSNRLTVIGTSLYYPFGIAIDPVGNRIYWCDNYYDKLETSDLFGDFREILLHEDSFVGTPYDVAIHAEYLYWTDSDSGKLKRINRYESNGSSEQVGSNVFVDARGLHVYELDECSSSPCQNNGTCMDAIDSFQCICREGFKGTLCEEEVDECSSSPCQNNGTCMDIIDSFQCSCPEGFTGTLCEKDIDECSRDPCYHGGICFDEMNEYRCQCLPGYSGLLCENEVDECSSSPCQNNGTCMDIIDSFQCSCPEGFTGTLCVKEVDECSSSPCQNNGTCMDIIDSFQCSCPEGFTGTLCEEDNDGTQGDGGGSTTAAIVGSVVIIIIVIAVIGFFIYRHWNNERSSILRPSPPPPIELTTSLETLTLGTRDDLGIPYSLPEAVLNNSSVTFDTPVDDDIEITDNVTIPLDGNRQQNTVARVIHERTLEDYFQLIVDVSEWWKYHGNVNMLKVLLCEFLETIPRTSIEQADDPFKLFELLRGPGLISETDIDIVIEAVVLANLLGVQSLIKKNVPTFPGFSEIVIRKFSKHRQNLIKFGHKISTDKKERIGQLYGIRTRCKVEDNWVLIYELEKKCILTEERIELFIDRLELNEMKLEADALK